MGSNPFTDQFQSRSVDVIDFEFEGEHYSATVDLDLYFPLGGYEWQIDEARIRVINKYDDSGDTVPCQLPIRIWNPLVDAAYKQERESF